MLQFLNFKRFLAFLAIFYILGFVTALKILSTREQKKIINEQKQIITQTQAHFCAAEKEKTKYVNVTPDCDYILNFDISDCLRAEKN